MFKLSGGLALLLLAGPAIAEDKPQGVPPPPAAPQLTCSLTHVVEKGGAISGKPDHSKPCHPAVGRPATCVVKTFELKATLALGQPLHTEGEPGLPQPAGGLPAPKGKPEPTKGKPAPTGVPDLRGRPGGPIPFPAQWYDLTLAITSHTTTALHTKTIGVDDAKSDSLTLIVGNEKVTAVCNEVKQ